MTRSRGGLAIALLLAATAAADTARPSAAADAAFDHLAKVHRIAEVAISPDGSRAA
jgi:hypothetical protein